MSPHTSFRHTLRTIALAAALAAITLPAVAQPGTNRHIPWPALETPAGGMAWPDGQALPHFSTPADPLDGLHISQQEMPNSEIALFAALQGLVNRTQPRIILLRDTREGKYKWPDNLGLLVYEYPAADRWQLVGKYQNEIEGLILYDTVRSPHYRNLATTLAGLRNALPATPREQAALAEAGIDLPVVEDLTTLELTTPVEIYNHLYERYWPACTHRVLVTLNHRDAAYIRDMAVATGAAVVWLDPRNEEEHAVLNKFLGDMTPGRSIMIGWWAEERSGIGAGTAFGISTIPSDFFDNATVYAGMSHRIDLPPVPKKPELDNKIYIAVFLSDGDNVQYCQHAMSELWDDPKRGIIPINWTISPGLADFGPGLLNYYYRTATPNDFFASGPSGMGYALIYDVHNKKWHTTERSVIEPYTRLSQQYLEKSGLRVITVWDEVNEQQMDAYADNCRYLYGITQEDWKMREPLTTVTKQNRLAFIPNQPCYSDNVEHIFAEWKEQIERFDGTRPLFLSAQGVSWKMGPENIVHLYEMLEKLSPGNIVICRGDHFFALYNEAHGMDFNLALSARTRATSSPSPTPAANAIDGSPAPDRQWTAEGETPHWIELDFGAPYRLSRYVVRHAGADGSDPAANTRTFRAEVSSDGNEWTEVDYQFGNTASVTDVDFAPVEARYFRLLIDRAGPDGVARIGDIEVYGSTIR
ncbi:MAG: discoidin domain-containing protein [Rikenellaceae bacterium]|nr:discoidin domain-containing protein [Rikenellaceae bacterium]